MGMYDYLGEYQVKIFNSPIYYGKEYGLGYIGGNLASYNKGEELPLQTLWYKYPNNFLILDKDCDNYDKPTLVLHMIRDGKYFDTTLLESIDDEINENIYDYNGNKLNVKSKQDAYNNIKLEKELRQKIREIEYSYFPEGSFQCIKNDMDRYDKLEPEYHKEIISVRDKYTKLRYLEEENEEQMTLGAYIDVLNRVFIEEDLERYNEVKSLAIQFINTLKEGYLDRYFEWTGDYLNEEDKDTVRKFLEKVILKQE